MKEMWVPMVHFDSTKTNPNQNEPTFRVGPAACGRAVSGAAKLIVSILPLLVLGDRRSEADHFSPAKRTSRRCTWCNPNLIQDEENWYHLVQCALGHHDPWRARGNAPQHDHHSNLSRPQLATVSPVENNIIEWKSGLN